MEGRRPSRHALSIVFKFATQKYLLNINTYIDRMPSHSTCTEFIAEYSKVINLTMYLNIFHQKLGLAAFQMDMVIWNIC